MMTTMSTAFFTRLFPERAAGMPDGSGRATVADGGIVETSKYWDITFYQLVQEKQNNPLNDEWVEVTDTIWVRDGMSNLLGTTAIR